MWQLRSDQRLAEWKNFRKKISELPVEQAVAQTTHLWSYAPFVNHYLDPDTPQEWPDPWELVAENYYCDLAKAVCMLYTLALSDHSLDLELRIYKDQNLNPYHVVWIEDGKYITNLIYDTVVNKTQFEQDQYTMTHRYTARNLRLEQY